MFQKINKLIRNFNKSDFIYILAITINTNDVTNDNIDNDKIINNKNVDNIAR